MMQGDIQGNTKDSKLITRFWSFIQPKPVLFSLFLASSLYAALVIGLLIWLAFNAEDTTQRRIAQSPSMTVIVKRPDTPQNETNESDTTHAQDGELVEQSPDAQPPASWNTDQNPNDVSQDTPQETPQAASQETSQATSPDAQPDTSSDLQTDASPATEQKDKKTHWQNLARDFNHDDPRPRIALIVVDLGITQNITTQAITQFPPDVALAFHSIAPNIDTWLERAHKAGHENLLAIPMEPPLYPQNDPGPETLLTVLSPAENAQRLQHGLKHTRYALGVIPSQGEKFITDSKALAPVLSTIKENGLIFIDTTRSAKSTSDNLARLARLPYIQIKHIIDVTQPQKTVQDSFSALEQDAKKNGQAIAMILPYPAAISQTKKWLGSFGEKNLLLAPISALLLDQKDTVFSMDSTAASIKK
jgi:polysaccharide deacetylase 2 family uncharacterized protein YibQ